MLLVETEPVSLPTLSSALQEELRFSLEIDLGVLILDRAFFPSVSVSVQLVEEEAESKEFAESFTPVRRNLLCF